MAANSSIILTQLDFDSYKDSLKTFLKSQDRFKDYDFDGSNLSVLLDVLSYNTYQNAFYLNMISNEMFLDSAKLRDSVISHAKELNYLPRSFRSSSAVIQLVITSTDAAKRSIVIPKGTSFTSRVDDFTYNFSTTENYVITKRTPSGSNLVYESEPIRIYEGNYLSDTYTVNYANPLVYKISNKRVDLESVLVTVFEDNGTTVQTYKRATSLFGHDENAKVFFLQPGIGDTYEVVFGDGVVGRKPKNNSACIIEYRSCTGELPNGAFKFINTARIDDEPNVVIETITAAADGAVAEDLSSIKYNAPRAFTTQERAVTSEDYENLLKANFPEINAVVAYGGEDATPPQYGRIFLSIDLDEVDGLPKIKEAEYKRFLRSRSSVAIEPLFVSPDYTYLYVNTNIKYNINLTGLNPEDIRTYVIDSILNHASINLNNFGRTLRYSKFIRDVDSAEASIISNETKIELVKYLTPVLSTTVTGSATTTSGSLVPSTASTSSSSNPSLTSANISSFRRDAGGLLSRLTSGSLVSLATSGVVSSGQNVTIDFKNPLQNDIPGKGSEYLTGDIHVVSSSTFTYNGLSNCRLEDDGDGVMRIVNTAGTNNRTILDIGTVDYDTGIIRINNFNITNYTGTSLKIYAKPRTLDITSTQNVILNILENDVDVSIEQIRE